MRYIIPISGKDSLTTAIVQRQLEPDLPYEFIFNDTGKEYPETLEWLDRVEKYLDQPIHHIGANLDEITRDEGILPSHKQRFCTRLAKIEPLQDYLNGDEATIYYGLRADEARIGYRPVNGDNITPAYPLRDLGLGINDVWAMVKSIDLKPPTFYWKELHAAVLEILGPNRAMVDGLNEFEFDRAFTGRTRPNCSSCFYQGLWELVWCYMAHPALFWANAELESEVGAEGYTFKQNWSYERIAASADKILRKRAMAVVKILMKKSQTGLFSEVEGWDETDGIDGLAITSCGLLCGK